MPSAHTFHHSAVHHIHWLPGAVTWPLGPSRRHHAGGQRSVKTPKQLNRYNLLVLDITQLPGLYYNCFLFLFAGFFDDLDEHSESLTLLCSIQDLVCYLQKVVEKLKDTWKFLWEAGAQYDWSGALVRSWKFRLGVQVFSVFSTARAQPRGERVAELNIWCSKVKGSKWNYTSEGSYLMTDSISQVCFQSICE